MPAIQKTAPLPAPARQKADWDDLRVFFYVVKSGSLTGAAAVLGLTQPTVTRRLDELEARLGAQLLIRGPGRIALTEAGDEVYDRVLTMERSAAAIERLVVNQDRRPEGRVGLSAPDGVAGFFLAPKVAEFQRENPKILLSINSGIWADAPLRAPTDISLQYLEETGADMIVAEVATVHYVLVASRQYLDLYGEPRSLADIALTRYIHHSAQKHQPGTWDSKTASILELTDPSLETNSSLAMLSAIKYGGGVGPVPTALLTLEPELVVLDAPPVASPKLWMTYHMNVSRSARIRRVADWIRTVFDARTHPWFRTEFVHPSEF
jgi:DNA-binding transcriptional LysR family regulator